MEVNTIPLFFFAIAFDRFQGHGFAGKLHFKLIKYGITFAQRYSTRFFTRRTTGCYLREKEVHAVYLVGLAGDICVFATAMDSLQNGFGTYIIEDGTRPLNAIFLKPVCSSSG